MLRKLIRILVTSSVTYCEPPETLFIEQFDLTYFAKNTSISFNISAASVVSNHYLLIKGFYLKFNPRNLT